VADRDLIVVGGGPAGLATAIEARMAGMAVTVLDRRRPPIDSACGEGLMPGGVSRLLRLGVEVAADGAHLFHGIRYVDGETSAEARFAEGAGLGIRRTELHRALVARAEALGAELRWGVAATGLDGDGVNTEGGRLRSRWLVAADGRLSRMRRWAGIATTTPRDPRFGVRRHFSLPPWTDLVEVHWGDDAEAYVTPVGPDTVGVAVLTRSKPVDFDRVVRGFPALAARLDGAEEASRDRGAGPFGQRAVSVVRGRLALVGDASGSLDPITGEGLSVAFAQAEALIGALADPSSADYPAAHRRIMRLPRTITHLLLIAERRPPLRRFVTRTLAAAPGLFSRVVGMVGRAGMDAAGRRGGQPGALQPPVSPDQVRRR
jgi:flavin-dependent dehydrogenase